METYCWLALLEAGRWVTAQGCVCRLGGVLNNGMAAQFQWRKCALEMSCTWYALYKSTSLLFFTLFEPLSFCRYSVARVCHCSRIDYCVGLLAGALKNTTDKQSSTQLRGSYRTLAYTTPRTDPLPASCIVLHWFDVTDRMRFRLCVQVYKYQHSMAPRYLVELCRPISSIVGHQHLWSATWPWSVVGLRPTNQTVAIRRTRVQSCRLWSLNKNTKMMASFYLPARGTSNWPTESCTAMEKTACSWFGNWILSPILVIAAACCPINKALRSASYDKLIGPILPSFVNPVWSPSIVLTVSGTLYYNHNHRCEYEIKFNVCNLLKAPEYSFQ